MNITMILLWCWGIFNFVIGIYEVYMFINRKKLLINYVSVWDNIKNGSITFRTFLIEAWAEYCKVDSRYIIKYSPLQYVWFFELLNFIISVLFLYFLINKNLLYIKIILLLSICNCSLYFLTLLIEIFNPNNTLVLDNIRKYASKWNLIMYYLIASIWLIVPIFIYNHKMLKDIKYKI